MQQDGFWLSSTERRFPMLRGRRSADVAIIGGGLSGLNTAQLLTAAGLRVILLEAQRVFGAASGVCAGIASFGSGYENARRLMGTTGTQALFQTRHAAFETLRSLAIELGCAWDEGEGFLVAEHEKSVARLEAEARAMQLAGLSARTDQGSLCPLPILQSVLLPRQATLDMERYMRGLLHLCVRQGLKVFEDSRVVAMESGLVYTQAGRVAAPYIVVATGYPIVNPPGWHFLRLWQQRQHLLPVQAKAPYNGSYRDIDDGFTLRPYHEETLLTINEGRVGTPERTGLMKEAYASVFSKPTGAYFGQAVRSADDLPVIGKYSAKTPNLFVATGFGLSGLVDSMVAAQAISADILGLPSDGYEVYERSPFAARSLPSTIGCTLRQSGHWISSQLRLSTPRCPHLGCKLRYQSAQRAWACPCHGSRFDDLGRLENAPCVYDARVRHRRVR